MSNLLRLSVEFLISVIAFFNSRIYIFLKKDSKSLVRFYIVSSVFLNMLIIKFKRNSMSDTAICILACGSFSFLYVWYDFFISLETFHWMAAIIHEKFVEVLNKFSAAGRKLDNWQSNFVHYASLNFSIYKALFISSSPLILGYSHSGISAENLGCLPGACLFDGSWIPIFISQDCQKFCLAL